MSEMKMSKSFNIRMMAAALSGAGILTLSACGGGGTSTSADPGQNNTSASSNQAAAAPKSVTLSGVAATGSALAGASIKIQDRTGATVCDTVADANGAYTCDLGTSPKAPFVITATLEETSLTSMFADAATSTVNVTPLTHLIAARLASNGDPAQLITDIQGSADALTKAKLDAAVDQVVAILKPVRDALSEQTNPLTGTFSANGSGHDKLLDALQVTIRPTGTSSNIEITVRTQPQDEAAEPVKVSFSSADTSPAPVVSSLAAKDLGTDNIPVMLFDMMRRMTACYALPLADRVTNADSAGSAFKADACKQLFLNNDPVTYLNNGARVGPNGAFSGAFRSGGNGVTFDRPNFEFYRANGDLVFSYRWVNAAGGTDNEQVVARKVDGVLKVIGNQYAYDARVRAWSQNRELVNATAYSHIDTGYNLFVNNRVDGSGNPVFDKVEVTTPRGNKLTLKPTSGLSYLALVNSANQTTGTSVVRLNGRYTDPNTAGHPKDRETSLFYADSATYTDEAIRAIPDQGVWKFEFYHADGVTPNVVQNYRTVSRAPTLAEVSMMSFAELTTATRADLVSKSAASGVLSFDKTPSANDPSLAPMVGPGNSDFWRVPSGALAPVSVSIYGRAPQVSANGVVPVVLGARYNDNMTVSTLSRKALMPCGKQSVSDLHCDATLTTQFARGSNVNSIEMWARSARQVEVSKMIGVYKL